MKLKNEKTLTFIKPGNFNYHSDIFVCLDELLERDFTKTVSFHLKKIPEDIIREHYESIRRESFYDWTINAFLESEQGIVLRVYSGNDIVQRVRNVIGDTDPQKAKSGTVRAVFSNDSLEVAFREKRYLNNVIHASSSVEDAEREIRLWRDYL